MPWLALDPGMDAVLERMAQSHSTRRSGCIADVRVKTLVKHADARGFFTESLKRGDVDDAGEPFIDEQPFAQMSRSLVYPRGGNPPEPIKAFHWHSRQWDYWDIVTGNARVVLVDLREESPTSGVIQELVAGENAPKVIAIPPRVAHGYQCLGLEPVLLVYYVTQPYDASCPDEGRIAWDDPRIGIDWSIANI